MTSGFQGLVASNRRGAVALIVGLALVALSACSGDAKPGDAAVWYVDEKERLTSTSTGFTATVSRLGCNGGVTGDVVPPDIVYGESEIVVTFWVTPKQRGDASCPGNDFVAFSVQLSEPIGVRTLVDGVCRGGGGASTTAFCSPDEVRYRP